MIKAIIIEDELPSRNNLKNLLAENCPDISVVGEAGTIRDGLALIKEGETTPDIAFLDIKLPDGQIFKLLDQLEEVPFDIIFITAYDQYAIKACEYASIGYLLKPIDPSLLKAATQRIKSGRTNKIVQRLEVFRQAITSHVNAFDKIAVPFQDGISFLRLNEIIRLEGEDNYTHIFLNNGEKITSAKTIKAYEEMLSNLNFYRIHKRHIINLNFMSRFVRNDGGYVLMSDNQRIEISRRRRPIFMELLKRIQEEM